MMLEADARGWGETAAEVAVLLSERGLGGNDTDLELRLRRWRDEGGRRAEAARGLARRWLQLTRSSRAKSRGAGTESGKRPSTSLGTKEVGACIALDFPDRLSKRRRSEGTDWLSDRTRAA